MGPPGILRDILSYLLIVWALNLALPRPLAGQTDSLLVPTVPDSTIRVLQPRTALLLGLIPGGGQIYNRAWSKALIVVAAESYYIYQFQEKRDQLRQLSDPSSPLRTRYLEQRNKFAWWVALVYIWGMLDAYVDAHLQGFPTDNGMTLPADSPTEFDGDTS